MNGWLAMSCSETPSLRCKLHGRSGSSATTGSQRTACHSKLLFDGQKRSGKLDISCKQQFFQSPAAVLDELNVDVRIELGISGKDGANRTLEPMGGNPRRSRPRFRPRNSPSSVSMSSFSVSMASARRKRSHLHVVRREG
jgi:hypothetical protein